jgi:hypothetical protein
MAAGKPGLNPNTHSVGFTAKLVTVLSISADGLSAITVDRQNTQTQVPMMVQRSKGPLPQPGDQWLITQDLGMWTFAAFIGQSPADFAGSGTGGLGITVSSQAPATGHTGDLWINSGGSNEVFRWSGSSWVALQWGTQAIADGAITAAKIAPGTITSQQIAPGAGITAGQVNFTINDIGGVKVSFGTQQPPSPSPGDIWFNPSAGNVLTTWNGNSWVEYQYGAGAILPGSLTGQQLAANAAIGSGQVNFTASDIGGINTSVSNTAPAGPNVGDLWYDGTNSYVLKAWSGTNWVPYQFGTNAIQAGSVTAALIAAGTITAQQIAAGTITAQQIAAGTITAVQIAAGSITATQIAANTITAAQIAAGTITASQIAASTITAAQIQAGSIDSTLIASSAIVAGLIAAGAIDGMTINAVTINGGTISGNDLIVSGTEGGLFVYSSGGTIVKIFTTAGSISWTCPAGVSTVKAEAVGSGAGGDNGFDGFAGSGAEYACEPSAAVTAGNTYTGSIGAPGSGGAASSTTPNQGTSGGNATMAFDAVTLIAHGGQGGGGQPGGTGSTNSIHNDGGAGGVSFGSYLAGAGGGSAGGAAGPGNAGGGASGNTPGNGGAAVDPGGPGGKGGTGGSSATAGSSPTTGPGGGGGGGGLTSSSGSARAGAAGAVGMIRLTYTSSLPTLIGSIAGAATTDPVASTSVPEGAKFDNLQVSTQETAPDGSTWTSSGVSMATSKTITGTDTWHTLSVPSGWGDHSTPTGNGIRYKRKVNGEIRLALDLQAPSSVSNGFTICTLPSGYRPTVTQHWPIATSSEPTAGTQGAHIDIASDGTVKCYGVTGTPVIGGVFDISPD